MFGPVPGKVISAADPDTIVVDDVIQKLMQCADPARAPQQPGVQTDRHHLGTVVTFNVKLVERILEIGKEFAADLVATLAAAEP